MNERLEKRLHDWKILTLSSTGKESLVKAYLQAIPHFIMSCFKLPKTVCNNMTACTIGYLWSRGKKDRSIHWVCKEMMHKKKAEGGLGFRSFDSMNKAMLMKQLWRITKYPELLVSKILKDKYGRGGNLLSCNPKPSDSTIWKSLYGVKEIFRAGVTITEGEEDIIWNFSSSGDYSVKTGYDLLTIGNCQRKVEWESHLILRKEQKVGQGFGKSRALIE